MPSYAKFSKDLLSNKRKLGDQETVMLIEECNARIQKKLPPKLKDPGSFIVPYMIGKVYFDKALCDLGASINLMPLSIFRKLGLKEAKVTTATLQLTDGSLTHPRGIIEGVFIKVEKFIFPADFLILDMEEDKMTLNRRSEWIVDFETGRREDLPTQSDSVEIKTCAIFLDTNPPYTRRRHFEELGTGPTKPLPSIQYAYLGESCTLPVIISNTVSKVEEKKLLRVLRENKTAIGGTIAVIKGISPSLCMHKILMEENFRPTIESQRRLNPSMKEVVRSEVLKLLDVGIIYPISDSAWTSLVQVVPKKGGITVVPNEKNELIPIRIVTGWRVIIRYQWLQTIKRKNLHLPLRYFRIPQDAFGLCNILVTFQYCMMVIFSDMVEKFMDDFSVFKSSFDKCLEHLNLVLLRSRETNLVVNWEKCHFMVQEGIVLGHRVSAKGIEVDKAKIQIFSKITKPLCNLLVKDVPFEFNEEYLTAFNTLKEKLTSALINYATTEKELLAVVYAFDKF
ncbi:uncharacterized protein LOC111397886 [Olea europaea var. sylvestris]|uniref:uncharacterized protein LOC111397886 n=1 Tax=Olea europaea var. sylvestris TaxID=158386 RepID=UPI000C1CEFA3|nr:uncharacterized protein LOC111397886 [Olea europaea var. sylvestris]